MDSVKGKRKKGLVSKTWERCRSIGGGLDSKISGPLSIGHAIMQKSKSLSQSRPSAATKRGGGVAPVGCFSVYVGPQKQKFVIKTEYANHPLFRTLLEEAESEYGFSSDGPLVLPCDVDLFWKVLMEMIDCDDQNNQIHRGCSFTRTPSSYQLLSPSKVLAMNKF